ncbi:MAG TPA: DNA polymerase domain-containing protein [Polyangiaceae bacterium]|jgi:DNA polymerase elongation subunit (family B)
MSLDPRRSIRPLEAGPHEPRAPGAKDELLFGWDPRPGIVSVWADRRGFASIWSRGERGVVLTREPFRAWVLAASTKLLDVAGSAAGRVACEELGGEHGSYRYLLSAPTFDAIEGALVTGARRLGRTIERLGDLGSEIHQLGSIEQFLVGSGCAYFRDLQYGDLSRMQIDFETTSLDPARGHIFLAAVRHGSFETTLEAPGEEDERRLVVDLIALIAARDPDVIENHNLFGFDLPFLATRAARWGIALAIGRGGTLARNARAPGRAGARGQMRMRAPGRELMDTMDAVRRYDFVARDLPSHGLKDVARHFGVAPAQRVYVRGSETYATYLRDAARLRAYALDDVREVDALSSRLFPATFELARLAPRRYSELSAAGPAMGVLEPILVRGYVRARAPLPAKAEAASDLPPHAGGAVHLFAAGVAHRVVKADVASLYPSLMCAFRVGPSSDRLGILLATVERLLALRLAHKAAARELRVDHSPEASRHEALQAAMKLVINSAYGYMGAGGMALFADRAAADEVTRRGRELLGGLLEDLRARGASLLEADTDGVYFAVPEGTTEAEERALVTAVAARLPEGIRLEYEGRYRAMFSYEVKNYALLGYDGELLIRGVALRSSRAEPFGARFLREALAGVLRGDAADVRASFLRTLSELRTRALPARDVATRVRITKSPGEYLYARAAHREAPYEALLAAGRRTWVVGARVRYYRSLTGSYRLVDDDADDPEKAPRDYDVDHYEQVLVRSFASRLARAYRAEDFERLFRTEGQTGLFDGPIDRIETVLTRTDSPHGATLRDSVHGGCTEPGSPSG